ncbi:MAG TPA: hypothetical protein VGM87_21910 [Roseomonas sp.]
MAETVSAAGDIRLETHRTRALVLCGALVAANLAAWAWALIAFAGNLELLGICAVVYGLGLRHAIDADHITAIDNVTRKMMQEKKRPVSVGFFFAIGHSAVVILVTVVVALAAGSMEMFDRLQGVGQAISTFVSASLLLAIAYMNVEIFLNIRRSAARRGGDGAMTDADDPLLAPAGLLTKLFRPILRLVRHSWHMLPLGFLFGLGFDTATEVAMFGVSTAQASKGLGLSSVLVLPILFTAGMSLIDTIDGGRDDAGLSLGADHARSPAALQHHHHPDIGGDGGGHRAGGLHRPGRRGHPAGKRTARGERVRRSQCEHHRHRAALHLRRGLAAGLPERQAPRPAAGGGRADGIDRAGAGRADPRCPRPREQPLRRRCCRQDPRHPGRPRREMPRRDGR